MKIKSTQNCVRQRWWGKLKFNQWLWSTWAVWRWDIMAISSSGRLHGSGHSKRWHCARAKTLSSYMIVRGTVTHLIFTTLGPPEIDHARKKQTLIVFKPTPGTCGMENKRMKDKPPFFSGGLFKVTPVKFSSNSHYYSIRTKLEAKYHGDVACQPSAAAVEKNGWMKRSRDPIPRQQYLPIRWWEDQFYLKATVEMLAAQT